MKNLKHISTLNQLKRNNIAQPLIRDNQLKNHLEVYHHHGIGENMEVFHQLKTKENVEAAGLFQLLEP